MCGINSIRKLPLCRMGTVLSTEGVNDLLLHVENEAVVHIANAFVSSSQPMMQELRRLKRVIDMNGLYIRAEWLPSVANRFADDLSRRFHVETYRYGESCGDPLWME